MVTVKLFGLMSLEAKQMKMELASGTIREVFCAIAREYPSLNVKKLEQAMLFVNGNPIQGRRRLSIKLTDGDELALISPSSGG